MRIMHASAIACADPRDPRVPVSARRPIERIGCDIGRDLAIEHAGRWTAARSLPSC